MIKKGRAWSGGSKINFFQIFDNVNIVLHMQFSVTDYFDREYYNLNTVGSIFSI